jgi:8-oxo-dGTP pyrophosphatase MutT (NUDIX family)
MTAKYKIYFNERFVLITDDPKESGIGQKYWYNFENPQQIFQLISTFEKDENSPAILIRDNDPKAVMEVLLKQVKYIKAAGGVVINTRDEYLFIYRLKKWDLPKGKMDKGEKTDQTAIREVCEETGLKKLLILRELPSTYHTYRINNEFIIKRTYWYEMLARDTEELIPQKEENIEEARWMPINEMEQVLSNTYPAIADIISLVIHQRRS